jgi:rhodanese-related sulfurtransferase
MLNVFKQIFGTRQTVRLEELIASGAVIVDVRSKSEFASGHFPKAVNIPLQQLQKNGLNLPKNKTIITCCASGMRSATAKRWLDDNGYTSVVNGGSWQNLANH